MYRKTGGGRPRLRAFIGACCLLLVCVSAYMLVSRHIREKREEAAFDALIRRIEQTVPPAAVSSAPPVREKQEAEASDAPADWAEPADDESPAPQSEPTPSGFHKYDALYEQNCDLFGWLSIDGTEINYPVMHTPDDPEYYLHRAFDGTYSVSGVPFLDGDCYVGCGNYIVYGHHMKSGTMFAELTNYAGEDFCKEHPVICFDTLDEAGEYEVLAAFYARVYRADEENVFRYYNYTDLTDEAVFDEYLSRVRAAALYDTGVAAEYGDRLLTLTTCSYHTTDGRFVVVARQKPE